MIKILVSAFLFLCPTIVLAQCGNSYGLHRYYDGPPISYGYYDGPSIRYYDAPPIVYESPVIRVTRRNPTITFYMGNIREETRVYKKVGYQDGSHRVPVINGIVPVMEVSGFDIVYRYDIGVPLSSLPSKSERIGGVPYGQTDVPSPDANLQKIEPQPPSGTKKPDDVQDPNKKIPPTYDDKTT
jgi:hypothetical protein